MAFLGAKGCKSMPNILQTNMALVEENLAKASQEGSFIHVLSHYLQGFYASLGVLYSPYMN